MFENFFKAKSSLKQRDFIERNIDIYKEHLFNINKINLETIEDSKLKELSKELLNRAKSGAEIDDLLIEAYAVVREVAHRVLGMRPFDVQVIAAVAMHRGKLVEMNTGEGKTLAAVLPAYLNALSGKGVHILTFNDYLAKRDAEWMGPIYRFLGLTVGYVKEGMSIDERIKAYNCDITYLTAKEAGFDYLKGFLCTEKEQLVHREFNFAIIDEADSILIDEARIPLVIAGSTEQKEESFAFLTDFVKQLRSGFDYDVDEYSRNVFLTEQGIKTVERKLDCGNLYASINIDLLTRLNCALHAGVLLKKDIDYIVRDNKVELVDEFTGRVADKRHWPDGLQAAVEAKEGISAEAKGRILDSITLQNFIQMYPKICGMTGTAQPAAEELKEFYKANVVVIPPNKPCIRKDYPDMLYTHREAKQKALISEIIEVHSTLRPILIGTRSVEESDELALELKKAGVECQVLNAKNNEFEAKIIANAGQLGAVTVSTNMAGRGTDIKLGGADENEHERAAQLGGLYVIGTNRHESRRIDDQLRGRSGRQGDPGSTRFFVSLEDELMKRYRLEELIPKALYPKEQEGPIKTPVVIQEADRAQRIIEGQNFDIRKNLCKYSLLVEEQRRIIHKRYSDLLLGKVIPKLLQEQGEEKYERLKDSVGEEILQKVEKQITLFYMNQCWADHLEEIAYIREGIHLVNVGWKNPMDEFNKLVIAAFDELLKRIADETVKTFIEADITKAGIDMEKEGLKGPSSTWTYLVSDSSEQFGMLKICSDPIMAAFNAPLLMGAAVYNRFKTRK